MKIMTVSNQNFTELFYVDWQLLLGLNHYCDYSYEPEDAFYEKYSKDLVLNAAYQLLCFNKSKYKIYIYGGEPTIHPYLIDLVQYLFTSGRDIEIEIKTNGLQTIKYYSKLINICPVGRLKIAFDVHFKYLDIKKLLILAAMANERKQKCKFILNYIAQYEQAARQFNESINKIAAKFSVEKEFAYPKGGMLCEWMNVQKSIAPVNEIDSSPNRHLAKLNYFCAGAMAAHVNPNGELTLGLQNHDKPFQPCVVQGAVFREGMPIPPNFEMLEQAQDWLKSFAVKALEDELGHMPPRKPDGGMDNGQKLRIALSKIKPAMNVEPTKQEARPKLWRNRQDEILKVWARLKDSESKKIFLSYLKSQLFGDERYLANILPDNDRASEYISIFDNRIQTFVAYAKWYECAKAIISGNWFDSLPKIMDALPNFEIELRRGQAGFIINAAITKHKLTYPSPISPHINGKPKISFILLPWSDGAAITETVNDIMSQEWENLEILVLLDGYAPDYVQTATDELALKYPWVVRPFRYRERLHKNMSWNLGLGMAQGEYVCMLYGGDRLGEGLLEACMDVMESEYKPGVAIFNEKEQIILVGDDALSLLNYGNNEADGIARKMYRTEMARKYAILPEFLANIASDDIYNWGIFMHSDAIALMTNEIKGHPPLILKTPPDAEIRKFLKNIEACDLFYTVNDNSSKIKNFIDKWEKDYFIALWDKIQNCFTDLPKLWDKELDEESLLLLEKNINIIYPIICKIKENIDCNETNDNENYSDNSIFINATEAQSLLLEYNFSVVAVANSERDLKKIYNIIIADNVTTEFIIINNGINNIDYDAWHDFSAIYPNIILLESDAKTLLGRCYNEGKKYCSGKFIIYWNCISDFEQNFSELLHKAKLFIDSDIIIFGVENNNEKIISNFLMFNQKLKNGDLGNMAFCRNVVENIDFTLDINMMNIDYMINAYFLSKKISGIHEDLMSWHDIVEKGISKISIEKIIELFYKLDKLSKIHKDANANKNIFEIGNKIFLNTWLPKFCAEQNKNSDCIPNSTIFARSVIINYAKELNKKRYNKKRIIDD